MKTKQLFWICLLMIIGSSTYAQNITTNTTINGTFTATGDLIIHNGATLTLAVGATLRMLPGRELRIRDGGFLVVNQSCTIESTNGGYWDGIIIDPTSVFNPDYSPAIIMIGGPYWVEANRITFTDATDAFECQATPDGTTRLRGFRMIGVDFSHCRDFFDYRADDDFHSTILSDIQGCTFTADANTDAVSLYFTRVNNLNITASEFIQPDPTTNGYWFVMLDYVNNIRFERNYIENDGIALGFTFNNINITHH